jgi:hypothetical protein
MNDLILRTRLEALEVNIGRVREFVSDLRKRNGYIDDMQNYVDGSRAQLKSVANTIFSIRHDDRLSDHDDIGDKLVTAQSTIDAVLKDLTALGRSVESLQDICFRLSRQEGSGIGLELRQGARKRPDALSKAIGDVRASLQQTPPKSAEAWELYRTKVHDQTESLFAEFVEFIGGLALRDIGLDEGVCELSDVLMRTRWFGQSSEVLTIPSRPDAVSMTWAQIIRLGFPEWTIWALPFTAQEFWFTAGRKHLRAEATLGGESPNDSGIDVRDPALQECLSDAFAMYTMGPAYAYASILLRMDPIPDTGGPRTAPHPDRVHAILAMWAMMDEQNTQPYRGERERMKTEWNAALALASVTQDPGRQAEIEAAVRRLFAMLESQTVSPFTVQLWAAAQTWAELLAKGNVTDASVSGQDLRCVINAAWLARVLYPETPTTAVAEAARKLWDRIANAGNGGKQGPDGFRPYLRS